MTNKTGKQQAKYEYDKELKRIKRFIKRAEERGYRFEEEILPKRPSKITQASVNKLKKITPNYLYGKSYALSDNGKIVSGLDKRKEERKKASQLGWETRRRKKDVDNINKLKSDNKFRSKFNEGYIVYQNILSMINDCQFERAREHLKSLLNNEIEQYGFDNVMNSLSQAPDRIIESATIALQYDCGAPQHESAIRELEGLLRGTIATAEELKDLQEKMDSDMYYNEVE